MSLYLDAAVDLSAQANQIAVDLAGDVASNLQTLRDFVAAHKARSQNATAKAGAVEDPENTFQAVLTRLRRSETNFAKAAKLIAERRKEIADLLAAIA